MILLVSAWQMMPRRRTGSRSKATEPGGRDWATVLRLHASYPDHALGRDVFYCVQRVPVGLLLMYGAGLISALLGIGSGVLKIPAMDTALRLPIKVSSATSNFMIGVTAAASGVAYFARGDIDPAIAGPVALGSVIGSVLGARFLMAVSGDRLRLLFVLVIIALAVQMLHAAWQGQPALHADMSGDHDRDFGLERRLATMLRLGTWVGVCVIAAGWVMSATVGPPLLHTAGMAMIQGGIALFILLPGLRVLLMAIFFVYKRDYPFSAIAALVLSVIVVGAALGGRMAGVVPG